MTKRFTKATVRNIGNAQFTIDGAVYVAKLKSEGTPPEKILAKKGLSIKLNEYMEVHLPYGYPLKDGKPVVSQKLIAYLRSGEIIRDEEELLKAYLISPP